VEKVTVNSGAPNIPPVADAGSDRIIDLSKYSIVLPGSGSDADGYIVSYFWSKISGPSEGYITDPTSAQSGASDLVAGVYQFQLTVTDNQGATATSIETVTVKSLTPNIPPVADAGLDRTIDLPKNSIVLPGSGSDADGYIVSYSWSKISGPSAGYITDPFSAQSGASGLVAGVYQFQLTVTDNQGATATSVETVTVNNGVAYRGMATDNNLNSNTSNSIQDSSSNQNLSLSINTVNDNNILAPVTVKVYPNPVHEVGRLEIKNLKANTKLNLVISDVLGRSVYQKKVITLQNITIESINMSNFKSGTYFLTVFFDGNKKQSIKVIKL
jgi:hypothetical protein